MTTNHWTMRIFLSAVLLCGGFLVVETVSAVCTEPGFTDVKGICVPSDTGLPGTAGGSEQQLVNALVNVMQWLLAIFGILALIAFIISGIMYLTSAGDQGRADTARQYMFYAIIGVVVGLSGVIIVRVVETLLGG